MNFSVTILGSNSAIPANGRHPSAQVLDIHGDLFLIDCGEGTQMRMNDFRIKRSKINQIFISHFHGDHIFGLPGLLTSFSLLGRSKPLEVFAPPGLRPMIDLILKTSGSHLTYELLIHEINPEENNLIFENKRIEVFSIPLVHRLPTCGFLFVEKKHLRNIIPEKITEYDIPFSKIKEIKKGFDFKTAENEIIPNSELTLPPKRCRSYAYCSDTSYSEKILPIIEKVDLLYHEATFTNQHSELASPRGHSTGEEAATIALKSNAGELILGHFSTRYIDLNSLLEEAKAVFPRSRLAIEGETFDIPF